MAEKTPENSEEGLKVSVLEVAQQFGIVLKDKQIEALLTFCLGNDVFVSLPTGYEKSMIYGLLPLIFDKIKGSNRSIVLCVSPLIAIMREQTAKFSALGINAKFVGEEQTDLTARHRVVNGQVQLVFISPENL